MTPHARLVAAVAVLFLALSVSCGGEEPDGVRCWGDAECPADAYCVGVVISGCGSNEEGTCEPRLAAGDVCGEAEDLEPTVPRVDRKPRPPCPADLVCNYGLEPPICAPPSAVGEPCGRSWDCSRDGVVRDPGEATPLDAPICHLGRRICGEPWTVPVGTRCDDGRSCSPELVCRGLGRGQFFCENPGGSGEPCREPDLARSIVCAEELLCIQGACRGPLASGEACATYREECSEGLVCMGDHHGASCMAPARLGEPCTGLDTCMDGLLCHDGRCTVPAGLGEDCSAGPACASGLSCVWMQDSRTRQCAESAGAGDACGGDLLCGDGLRCTGSVCAPPGDRGAGCGVHADCAGALWCIDGVCTDPPGAGEPCIGTACGSGLVCIDGTCLP